MTSKPVLARSRAALWRWLRPGRAELLNVSTTHSELWRESTRLHRPHQKERDKVSHHPSHGGSTSGRAFIDGLEADVVTLASILDPCHQQERRTSRVGRITPTACVTSTIVSCSEGNPRPSGLPNLVKQASNHHP